MTREEQEIREALNKLSSYRIPNSDTELVTLKSVERVLNLVFRGHRDVEPKTHDEIPLYNEVDIYDVKYAMESGDFVMVIEDRKVSLIDEEGNRVNLGTVVTVLNTEVKSWK